MKDLQPHSGLVLGQSDSGNGVVALTVGAAAAAAGIQQVRYLNSANSCCLSYAGSTSIFLLAATLYISFFSQGDFIASCGETRIKSAAHFHKILAACQVCTISHWAAQIEGSRHFIAVFDLFAACCPGRRCARGGYSARRSKDESAPHRRRKNEGRSSSLIYGLRLYLLIFYLRAVD